jgi:hypothetical protein
MADKPDDPQGRPPTGDNGRDERRPDETAAFDPLADDEPRRPPGDPDVTAVYGTPPGEAPPPRPDRTAEQPTIPQGPPDADRTAQLPPAGYPPPGSYGDDRTAQLPPPGEPTQAWAGRAGVPPPGAPPRGPVPEEWAQPEDPRQRRWWMPILIGLVVVVLLAVLAFGLWLLLRDDSSTPTPIPTATATSAAPTTAAPTTTAPSPTATTQGPVVVPPLLGLTEEQARGQLDAVGLGRRLQYRAAPQDAGTVIDADPEPGSQVPPGSTITLVISTGPTSAPTTGPPTPSVSPS